MTIGDPRSLAFGPRGWIIPGAMKPIGSIAIASGFSRADIG